MAERAHKDLLDTETIPDRIINRSPEQETLRAAVARTGNVHLYLHGPRGAGKTLLARHALTTSSGTTCYLSCRTADTQYKVLAELYAQLTGDTVSSGYHTAQLQDRLADALQNIPAVLVLDDLAFLLQNDGCDLLYYLTRLGQTAPVTVIGISANYATLASVVDDRTYSSWQPQQLPIDSYSQAQAARILRSRIQDVIPSAAVTTTAIDRITATSTNITLGLHWLVQAAAANDTITVDVVDDVQRDALRQYRTARLSAFTPHHRLVLRAIEQLTDDGGTVYTGPVYDRYTDLCRFADVSPLTARRISDYITHLKLLNLIDVTHHDGGETGKTREIRLTPIQEL